MDKEKKGKKEDNSDWFEEVTTYTRLLKQPLSANLHYRIQKNIFGRAELALIVDHKTSGPEIQDKWPEIKRLCDLILKKQGPDMSKMEYEILETCNLLFQRLTYRGIAGYLNFRCEIHVKEILIALQKDNQGDFYFHFNHLKNIMETFNAEDWTGNFTGGLLNLIEDLENPWLPDGEPIWAKKVQNKLEGWRELEEKRALDNLAEKPDSYIKIQNEVNWIISQYEQEYPCDDIEESNETSEN